jgi:hypothetical protein
MLPFSSLRYFMAGYCTSWSLFFLELCMKSDKLLSKREYIDVLLNKLESLKNMTIFDFINRYAGYVQKIADKIFNLYVLHFDNIYRKTGRPLKVSDVKKFIREYIIGKETEKLSFRKITEYINNTF